MKLYHSSFKNFGDAITPFFWQMVAPHLLSRGGPTLVSFGSILNKKHCGQFEKSDVLVCGAAWNWGEPVEPGDKWKWFMVRDRLTRGKFGLSTDVPLGDPLYLAPLIFRERRPLGVSFMPHRDLVDQIGIAAIRRRVPKGFRVIHPGAHPLAVLSQLLQSRKVYTGSLHAAILCDAYRIEWAPVCVEGSFNKLKWEAWYDMRNAPIDSMPKALPSFSASVFDGSWGVPTDTTTLERIMRDTRSGIDAMRNSFS